MHATSDLRKKVIEGSITFVKKTRIEYSTSIRTVVEEHPKRSLFLQVCTWQSISYISYIPRSVSKFYMYILCIVNLYDGRAAPRRVNGKTGGAKSPQGRGARGRAEQGIGVRGIEHRLGQVGQGGA